jgi:putative nucleotidyltransferase with HDIG domain
VINIPISELKPGMRLTKDVRLTDGRLLLLAGFAIKPLYIRKLEAFCVQSVYVEEGPYELIEEYTEEKLYKEAHTTIRKVFALVRDNKEVDFSVVKNTVNEIIQMIISNEAVMMHVTGVRDIDNYTFLHCVDVCIYSVIIGKKLGYSKEQLINLGIGAILHDIGKCKISLEILQKPGKLTDNEFSTMKLHTVFGCEIIKSAYGLSSKIANIAFQHHEKWDGSGYPIGTKAESIDPFSRIVTVADIYDALTADRVYKKRVLPHIAAEYIKNNASKLFDPYLVDLFINNIAVYTEGTIVLLNTGEVGIVISSGEDSCSKQKIKIIANKAGPPVLTPYTVDLAQTLDSEIVEIFI